MFANRLPIIRVLNKPNPADGDSRPCGAGVCLPAARAERERKRTGDAVTPRNT